MKVIQDQSLFASTTAAAAAISCSASLFAVHFEPVLTEDSQMPMAMFFAGFEPVFWNTNLYIRI